MKIEDVINRDELKERLDDDMDLFKELTDIFIDDSVTLLTTIEEAIQSNDAEKLGKTAHTLKGAVSNFSAFKAYDAALTLEKIGKSGDLSQANKAFDTLKVEINSAKEAMKLLSEEGSL